VLVFIGAARRTGSARRVAGGRRAGGRADRVAWCKGRGSAPGAGFKPVADQAMISRRKTSNAVIMRTII